MRKNFNRPSWGHKSYTSAVNGVSNYIAKNHLDLIENNKKLDFNQRLKAIRKIMRRYFMEKDIKFKDSNSFADMDFNSNLIQDDFNSFKNWLKTLQKS